jgi:hypothetical protein
MQRCPMVTAFKDTTRQETHRVGQELAAVEVTWQRVGHGNAGGH